MPKQYKRTHENNRNARECFKLLTWCQLRISPHGYPAHGNQAQPYTTHCSQLLYHEHYHRPLHETKLNTGQMEMLQSASCRNSPVAIFIVFLFVRESLSWRNTFSQQHTDTCNDITKWCKYENALSNFFVWIYKKLFIFKELERPYWCSQLILMWKKLDFFHHVLTLTPSAGNNNKIIHLFLHCFIDKLSEI